MQLPRFSTRALTVVAVLAGLAVVAIAYFALTGTDTASTTPTTAPPPTFTVPSTPSPTASTAPTTTSTTPPVTTPGPSGTSTLFPEAAKALSKQTYPVSSGFSALIGADGKVVLAITPTSVKITQLAPISGGSTEVAVEKPTGVKIWFTDPSGMVITWAAELTAPGQLTVYSDTYKF